MLSDAEGRQDDAVAQTAGGSVAPSASKVFHFTPAERVARGRAARAEAPRRSHAALDLAPERDPVALVDADRALRVQDLVPIRYGRMLVSAFTFYRGAAMLMANDLVATPRSGLNVQLCGDAHLSNFGGFASPERAMVFDLNDFDETHGGPFEWDVKRLATSFESAARHREFGDADREASVLGVTRAYREAMRTFAEMRNLDVWYTRLDVDELRSKLAAEQDKKVAKTLARNVAKAQTK